MSRGSDEAKPDRAAALDAALDKGSLSELPPNRPHGVLGSVSPDMRKSENYDMGTDAGVSQELDGRVVLLAIVLSYVLFFPAAFVIVWRTRTLTGSARTVLTVVMSAGVVVAGFLLLRG